MFPAIGGGGHGNGGDLQTQRALGNAWHQRFGIKQSSEFTTPSRRCSKRLRCTFGRAIRPSRKRDARPIRPQYIRIELIVGEIMEDREDMMK